MDFTWVKIPDVLFFQEGPGVRNTQYTDKGVKLLNVANLVDSKVDLSTSDRYISEEEAYGKYKHFLCDSGDFIVASSGIKVEYIDKKMGFIDDSMLPLCMNTSTIRFKVLDKSKLDIKYFMYYLKSHHFKDQLAHYITGSAQLNYGPSHLKKMEMPLVNMEKQAEIIERLDLLQSIITHRRTQLEKLDLLVKARFVEMFGDPVSNSMGWKKKRFDEICENLDSRRKPITATERISGIYPYYGASGIVDYVENYIFDEDILLVSEDGANLLLRSTPIAFSVSGKVWVNNHAHVVRFKKMSLQKYIEIYFSLIDISDNITGSAQPKLNQAKLNSIMIPIPEDKLLEQYLFFIKTVDKSKVAVQKALDEAQLLFDSLMQEYFG